MEPSRLLHGWVSCLPSSYILVELLVTCEYVLSTNCTCTSVAVWFQFVFKVGIDLLSPQHVLVSAVGLLYYCLVDLLVQLGQLLVSTLVSMQYSLVKLLVEPGSTTSKQLVSMWYHLVRLLVGNQYILVRVLVRTQLKYAVQSSQTLGRQGIP